MIKIKKKSIKGKGLYDKTVNYLTGSKLKDGEKHVLMWDNGKIKAASYSGPGTDIVSALKENRKPLNKVDKTAQAHDIRYSLSSDYKGIKIADKKMVDKLNQLQKNKEENLFNILPSKYGIQANQLISKIIPEKNADKFVNYMTGYKEFNKNLTKQDKLLLEDKLSELEKEGFGIKKRKNKKRK